MTTIIDISEPMPLQTVQKGGISLMKSETLIMYRTPAIETLTLLSRKEELENG